MPNKSFDDLTQDVLAFRDARNWKQFHTLNHLAAGLQIEAGELQELFLWKTDEQAQDFIKAQRAKSASERNSPIVSSICSTSPKRPAFNYRMPLKINLPKTIKSTRSKKAITQPENTIHWTEYLGLGSGRYSPTNAPYIPSCPAWRSPPTHRPFPSLPGGYPRTPRKA